VDAGGRTVDGGAIQNPSVTHAHLVPAEKGGGVIATIGQAALAYSRTGDGQDGPPVLLLHAGVTDQRSWAPLVDALGPSRTTIAFDRRGFGETRYEPETFSSVDDALAVLDAAGVGGGPVAVVGASMGGRIALDLVLAHPQRVAALVLIGSAMRGAPLTAHADLPEPERQLSNAIDMAEAAGDLEAVNRFEAHLWLDGPTTPEGRVGGTTRELFLDMNRIALGAPEPGPELELPAAWDRLDEVTVPTVVLVGELDLHDCRARAAVLADRIPDARLDILSGTAHLPHLEAHPGCLTAVTTFLAGR
jgi:pimeloyl-ACP methyl ester carboxylesterase